MIALKEFNIGHDFENSAYLKGVKSHKKGPLMMVMDHLTGKVLSTNHDLEQYRTRNLPPFVDRSVNSSEPPSSSNGSSSNTEPIQTSPSGSVPQFTSEDNPSSSSSVERLQ